MEAIAGATSGIVEIRTGETEISGIITATTAGNKTTKTKTESTTEMEGATEDIS